MPDSLSLQNLSRASDSAGFSTLGGLSAIAPEEQERLRVQVARELSPRYNPESMLGYGAFATVWRVRDQVTGHLLAAKRFQGVLGSGAGFYRELNALFRLDHPNVVQIVNLLEVSPRLRYLFLEHCGGGTLRQAMRDQRRLGTPCAPTVAAEVGRQIALGLATAHRLNLIHRDLKPENILFVRPPEAPDAPSPISTGRGPVKIVDFGLAQALSRPIRGGRLAALSGTPLYMAPERFHGETGRPSDIYPVGLMLFELLHGRPAFEGSPESLARQHIQEEPRYAGDLTPAWRSLLEDTLAKDPARRPDAAALAARLAVMAVPFDDRPAPASGASRIRFTAPSTPPTSPTESEPAGFDRCPGVEIVGLIPAPLDDGWIVGTRAGLFHYREAGGRRVDFRATPPLRALRTEKDGTPLLIDEAGDLWRVPIEPAEPLVQIRANEPIADAVACNDGRIVAAGRGRLLLINLFGQVSEDFPIPYGRQPEHMLALAGGGLAVAVPTSSGQSRCLILSMAGARSNQTRLVTTIELPGRCLDLTSDANGRLHALIGDSTAGVAGTSPIRIEVEERSIIPLQTSGATVEFLGRPHFTQENGSLLNGLTPQGELLQWQDDGRLARIGSAVFREGVRMAACWSGRRVSAWVRQGETDWLSVRPLPAADRS